MDMSGGAAVLEATGAIAELGLARRPDRGRSRRPRTCRAARAIKPGDIITQLNGKTVEINNTDAEGRLILADALTWCARQLGAERIVDLATLTGAVVVALGSTYAGLISNDDELGRGGRPRPASATGELAWRLPLHPEYKELTKGTVADLTNAAAKRKAGTIYAASFLEEFVEDVPGRTSTSPAPPGTSAASTSARARPASASACSSSSPRPRRPSPKRRPGLSAQSGPVCR